MVHPRSDLDLYRGSHFRASRWRRACTIRSWHCGFFAASLRTTEAQTSFQHSISGRKKAINHTAALWAILRQESKDQYMVPFIGLPLSLTASYVLDLRPPVKFEMACDMSEELQAKLERWARSTVQRENPDRKAVIIKSQTWGCRCTMSDAGRFPSRGRALVGLLFCPLMFLFSMVFAKTSLALEM